MTTSPHATPPSRPPWRPRFGLAEMMLAMMIFSVMAASGSYLMRAINQGQGRAVFVIFTLAAPIALVLVLSFYKALRRWLTNLNRR